MKLKTLTYRVIVPDEDDSVENVNSLMLNTLCFALEGVHFINDEIRESTLAEVAAYVKEFEE